MKYMGSKRAMLGNGLGELLASEVQTANRFVDLFTGSSAVAAHVATKFAVPVLAYDLQSYSAVLAGAVLHRDSPIEWQTEFRNWRNRAASFLNQVDLPEFGTVTQKSVQKRRSWCKRQDGLSTTQAYGGHYFSPKQALWIDALRAKLPVADPARTVALAALIQAASQCAAAPGHTAQPFQPTRTAKPFLEDAWQKDILARTRAAFQSLAEQHAKCIGASRVANANDAAIELRQGDLVFIDPPYSGVHYSRFYHVLETIAQGTCEKVSGKGRYPPRERRPRSSYSVTTESQTALNDLFEKLSIRKVRGILTFPAHECSNGLSGEFVSDAASKHFTVTKKIVKSKFSTLGGTGREDVANEGGRSARQHADELILVLNPK